MAVAIGEIFLRAYQSLTPEQREEVLAALLTDDTAREDLLDIALFESRAGEPSRPLSEIVDELRA
jgi:hypothetical protein